MKAKKDSKTTALQIVSLSADGFQDFLLEHPAIEKYSERINNRIRSEYGVIEEIITHSPSIGNYYERLLESNLKEYLPSKWKLGTGFVFDDFTAEVSPQIDLIVYEDNDLAPIFRAGDLIVVRPEQVRGIIEVKKRLRTQDIDDLVDKYLFSNTGTEFGKENGIQILNIFTYEKTTSVEKYFDRLVNALRKKIASMSKEGNPALIRHAKSLTIPIIYFLDDHRIITSRAVQKNLVHELLVEIQAVPYTTGGASDLFSRFIWHSNKSDMNQIRFSTTLLYESVKELQIKSPIILRKFVSAGQIYASLTKKDLERIDKKAFNAYMGFYIPYGSNISDLDDLQKKLDSKTIGPVPWEKLGPKSPGKPNSMKKTSRSKK